MRKSLKISLILALLFMGVLSLSSTTPVSAAREGAEWYYDNFTPEQRLHVRIAMDYAIPRDQIIASVLQGLGQKIASPVEANDGAYDPTVTAREFNVTKALDHMEQAFGYRYNASADTDEERRGYFAMTLMAPTSRDDRMEWAALTTKSFQDIGIDVTLKYAGWNIGLIRTLSPDEDTQFKDYAHGGYDGFFIGWTGSPESDVKQWFGKDNFVPEGSNLGYVDNAEVDDILDRALGSVALQDRLDAFDEFQQWFKDNLPYFIMLQLKDLWAKDPHLHGVSFSFDYPNMGNWTHDTLDVVTIHNPAELLDMNPLMASSYYDFLVMGYSSGIYEGLCERTSLDANTYYPRIAESWTTSADGLVWTFKIKDGIKFSDGSDCTVDDVIFTYSRYIDPEVVAWGGTSMAEYLNQSGIVRLNDSAVQFTLNKFYAYADGLWSQAILSETEMGDLPKAEWASDETTTTYCPLGTGPYKFVRTESSVVDGYTTIVLNTYYEDALRAPVFANANRIPTIKTKVVEGAAAAVASLKSGAINIIDSNVALQPFRSEIETTGTAEGWGEIKEELGWGHQGFYINQINPIWGLNPMDPRELYPEDYQKAPFDLTAVFFAILMLASIQIVRKRR
jgi:ABC-type transport system substrate-binding protein